MKQHGKRARALDDRENQLNTVYGASHDLKGLATTYGYPLITRYADSLCKLLANEEEREIAPAKLIEAHIYACRTAMRNEIKAPDHPVGIALANELETQVYAIISKLKPPESVIAGLKLSAITLFSSLFA